MFEELKQKALRLLGYVKEDAEKDSLEGYVYTGFKKDSPFGKVIEQIETGDLRESSVIELNDSIFGEDKNA
jgi:hypothetical protein